MSECRVPENTRPRRSWACRGGMCKCRRRRPRRERCARSRPRRCSWRDESSPENLTPLALGFLAGRYRELPETAIGGAAVDAHFAFSNQVILAHFGGHQQIEARLRLVGDIDDGAHAGIFADV